MNTEEQLTRAERASFLCYYLAQEFCENSGLGIQLESESTPSSHFNIVANALNAHYGSDWTLYDLMAAYWNVQNYFEDDLLSYCDENIYEILEDEDLYCSEAISDYNTEIETKRKKVSLKDVTIPILTRKNIDWFE
jgi:hypothetical protein